MLVKTAVLATLLALVLAMAAQVPVRAREASSMTAWDFTFTSIDGKPMPLAEFRGKVVLIVNTASFCGYTRQYKTLQALHEKYAARGFAVIGVPSNDFNQETKDEAEIKGFCEGIFGVTFPLTNKNVVRGEAAHPFYKWARDTLGADKAPRWNFHKYLVGRDGRIVASYVSAVEPDGAELLAAVERELGK
jgi:glutathione peroxidase